MKIVLFKCDQCDYGTNYKSSLTTHKAMKHSDLRPFKCEICEYKCLLQIQLKNHMKSNHTAMKYKCKDCDYFTDYIANIWEHTSVKHNENLPNFTEEKNDTMILKVVAEQNADMMEEIQTLKKEQLRLQH